MSKVIVGTDRGRRYFARPGGAGWTIDITEAAIVDGEDDPLYRTLRAAPPLHLERIDLMDRAEFVEPDGTMPVRCCVVTSACGRYFVEGWGDRDQHAAKATARRTAIDALTSEGLTLAAVYWIDAGVPDPCIEIGPVSVRPDDDETPT